MKRAEYQHSSMAGTYWVPCEVIGEDEDRVIISFCDTYTGETIERTVKPVDVRWVAANISEALIDEAAVAAALVFKDHFLQMEVTELEAIAQVVKDKLMSHFGV